jgi:hypothetical protein
MRSATAREATQHQSGEQSDDGYGDEHQHVGTGLGEMRAAVEMLAADRGRWRVRSTGILRERYS